MPQTLEELKLPGHAARVAGPEEWKKIHDPALNLVLQARELEASIQRELAASRWPADFLTQLMDIREEDWSDEFWSRELSFLKPGIREWLVEDLRELVTGFARLQSGSFRASLMIIHGVMCPAFHADSYNYRLITTYRGPGTEWVPDSNVNHAGFEHDNYADRILDEHQIRTVPAGHIALMQGNCLPSHVAGLVHRSPPNPAGASPRIVFRIDY